MKQDYIPSMTGSNYAVDVAQLEDNIELHQDIHMFFMKTKEEQPDIITEIMTQLFLKAGLKKLRKKTATLYIPIRSNFIL